MNFNLANLCCSSCNFSSRPPRPSPSSTRLRLVELGLGLEWSQRWSTSCNFRQVHLGQVEVKLGFASLDFNLASMDLIGVCGGSPRATPMKSNFGPVGSPTRLRLVGLQLSLDGLDRSLWWITSCNSTQVQFLQFEVQFLNLNFKLQKLNLRPSR